MGVPANWTFAGTFFYHSGYPFSIVDSSVRSAQGIKNASGISTQQFLADYLGGPTSCTAPNTACFSTSQFASAATQLNYGNLARNSFRGPGYFDTDLNFNRTFPVGERLKFQIGAYFFNILNHPELRFARQQYCSRQLRSDPEHRFAPTSAYGVFQGSAVSSRIIQTQIKVTF